MSKYSYEELAANGTRNDHIIRPVCHCKLNHGSPDMCFSALETLTRQTYNLGRNVVQTTGFDINVVEKMIDHLRINGLPRAFIVQNGYDPEHYIQFDTEGSFDLNW